MGEYLTIIWDPSTPAAAAVEWDSAMIIGKPGTSGISETTITRVTSDNWQTTLSDLGFSTTDQLYLSVGDFFGYSPTPGGTLTICVYVSGAATCFENVPLKKVDNDTWETPIKPVSGWCSGQCVQYYPDSSLTGHWLNCADGTYGLGFTIEEGPNGNWNGRLTFGNGLSGQSIDDPIPSTAKITASFQVNDGISPISESIENYQVSLVALSLSNHASKKDYPDDATIFGSQLMDISTMLNMIAGRECEFFWALPGNAQMTGSISGSSPSIQWKDLKNSFVGTREDFTAIKMRPSSNNPILCDDMACGMLGLVAAQHPHNPISFKTIHMGIYEPSDLVERAYLKDGQIMGAMQWNELEGSPNLVTYGFTFGTGDSARIAYVRCKNIISKELRNGLKALLASGTVRMSYAGMQKVKDKIKGIFKTLVDQGIVDKFGYVKIPVETDLLNNTAAGRAANAAREIPAIEIGFYFFNNLEKITITSIKNVAS